MLTLVSIIAGTFNNSTPLDCLFEFPLVSVDLFFFGKYHEVDPDDPRRLGAAIIALCVQEDLHAEMREKGLAQAAQFTWEKTARETLAAYQDVLG